MIPLQDVATDALIIAFAAALSAAVSGVALEAVIWLTMILVVAWRPR